MRKPEREIFNYNHLYYFFVAFNHNTNAEAATALNVARAGLTKQIHLLQKQIGLKLFYKEGRKRVLTPEGKLIHEHCYTIFHNENELRRIILSLK